MEMIQVSFKVCKTFC